MNRFKLHSAGVNVNSALARLGNDKAMYEGLLRDFIRDDHFVKLCEAVAAKDVNEAFSNAHALKGVAGNLSFDRLSALIGPVVEKLRTKDAGIMDEVAEDMVAVKAAYEQIIAAIG